MALTPSVKLLKLMPFKAGSRIFSNRYHFSGGTPADATHWHTLMDAIVLVEKTLYGAEVTITEAIGYAAGSDVPVASKNYATTGTLTPVSGNTVAPGEVAALVRYSTSARTTKNHPIYLFNYYHHAWVHTAGAESDLLDLNQKANMSTYAADWITGFSDGTNTYKRSSPNGADATGSIVEEYVTHRDFPYSTSV